MSAAKPTDDVVRIYRVDDKYELSVIKSIADCPHCGEQLSIKQTLRVVSANKVEFRCEPSLKSSPVSDFDKEFIEMILQEGKGPALIDEVRAFFRGHSEHDADKHSRSAVFACPHCQAPLQAMFRLALLGLRPLAKKNESVFADPLVLLSDADRELYLEWQKNGLLELFVKATGFSNPGSVPRKPKAQVGHIRNWLHTCEYAPVPAETIFRVSQELGTTSITFYSAQGVMGIIADGYIRSFIPHKYAYGYGVARPLLEGGKLQNIEKKRRQRGEFEKDELWVKTRFGYCVGQGVFFEALQLESLASHGSATNKQRGTT